MLNLLLKQYSQFNIFFILKYMKYKLNKNVSIFSSYALTHISLRKYLLHFQFEII